MRLMVYYWKILIINKYMENKKVILITEDEEMLRSVVRAKLTNEGFSVIEANNGEEGLAMSLGEHPDLILLDIMMPKMDGMSMLKKLREDEWGKNVPVIMLTNISSGDENINKEITELEPTYYLIKNNESLKNVVEKIKERLGLL